MLGDILLVSLRDDGITGLWNIPIVAASPNTMPTQKGEEKDGDEEQDKKEEDGEKEIMKKRGKEWKNK